MELAVDPLASAPLPGPTLTSPLPGQAGGAANQANEYWDINGVPSVAEVQHNAAQESEFTELEGDAGKVGSSRQKMLGIFAMIAVLLGVVGYAGYLYFIEERDLLQEVKDLISGSSETIEEVDEEPAVIPRREAREAPAAPAPKGAGRRPVVGNPYWHLPNAILGTQPSQERLWTAEEEETWRAGLAHRFSYQRWKTVQDVRQMRLKGSEAILWDALQDKKLWTRGFAAVALAEIDVPVSLQTLDAVMQNARSELIADFFERFTKRCSPGQCFVLRQVIRLMDAKGRLIALQGIARSKDALRDLYLTAATLDPDKRVKKWIQDYFAWRPLDPDKYNALVAVAKGKQSGEHLLDGVKAAKRSLAGGSRKSAKKHESTLDLSTEEDLDKEMEQLDKDAGDVEIYEPDTGPAVKDESDADSFEYAE